MINNLINYILLLSLLTANACFVKKEATPCMDSSKQLGIVKEALDYVVQSPEYLSIFEGDSILPYVVYPQYVYFSFDRLPLTPEDSILRRNEIRSASQIENTINDCFFKKRDNKLLDYSSTNKSNQLVFFTGSDDKYLIMSIQFASKDLTLEYLKSNSFEEDICQEWLFFFILEEGKIKHVIHSSIHC